MGLGRSSWEHPCWAVMLTGTQPQPRGDAGAPNPHPAPAPCFGATRIRAPNPPTSATGSLLCLPGTGFALPRPCSSPGSSRGPRGAPFVSADLLTTCKAGDVGAAALIGGVSCLLSITQLASARRGKPQRPATGWGVGSILKSPPPEPSCSAEIQPQLFLDVSKGAGGSRRGSAAELRRLCPSQLLFTSGNNPDDGKRGVRQRPAMLLRCFTRKTPSGCTRSFKASSLHRNDDDFPTLESSHLCAWSGQTASIFPPPPSFINSGSFVSFEASIEVFESPSGGRRRDGGCGAPPQPAEVKATQFNRNKLEDVGYRMENWKVFHRFGRFPAFAVAGGGCSREGETSEARCSRAGDGKRVRLTKERSLLLSG